MCMCVCVYVCVQISLNDVLYGGNIWSFTPWKKIYFIISSLLCQADPPAKESYQMSLYVDWEAY